jgi:prepilin-type N-terminal cleavage/methylation domain-containing protein
MAGARAQRTGFTLVELIVVIAIILTLSVLSLNAYLSFTTVRRASHAAQMLVSTLSAARSQAVAQQAPYRVVIQRLDPLSGQPHAAFWIDEMDPTADTSVFYPTASDLASGVERSQVQGIVVPPEGVVVSDAVVGTTSTVSAPSNPAYAVVVFSPTGSSPYASIRLVDTRARDDASRVRGVKVYPATGRALIQGGSL